MFSLHNLKYHCRTCLVKLESGDDGIVSIHKRPDVEHLIRMCLEHNFNDGDLDIHMHMPNLCRFCFNKWRDFAKLCDLTVKNDEKLRTDLNAFVEIESTNDLYEIEKYETESPFYEYKHSDTSCESISQSETLITSPDKISQHHDLNVTSTKTVNLYDNTKHVKVKSPKSKQKTKRLKQLPEETAQMLDTTLILYKGPMDIFKEQMSKPSPAESAKMMSKSLTLFKEPMDNPKVSDSTSYPCEMYFDKPDDYDLHVRKVHEGQEKPHRCQICHKDYKWLQKLIDHMDEMHSKGEQDLRCELCNKTFKLRCSYRAHVNNHRKSSSKEDCNPVNCDQCSFVGASQKILDTHKRYKHTLYKCEQCPSKFKCRYNLKSHFIKYHGPYVNKSLETLKAANSADIL